MPLPTLGPVSHAFSVSSPQMTEQVEG